MRKLILISALLLVSASAEASESRGLALAAADMPAAAATDSIPQPLPPVAKSDTKTDDAKPQAADSAKSLPPRSLPLKPRSQARRYQSEEARARRIAARYGISW